jgi:hypothetical protein
LTKRPAQEIAVEAGADKMLAVIIGGLGDKGKEVWKELGLLNKNVSGDAVQLLFNQREKRATGDGRMRITIMGDDFALFTITIVNSMCDTENDIFLVSLDLSDAPQEPLCLA